MRWLTPPSRRVAIALAVVSLALTHPAAGGEIDLSLVDSQAVQTLTGSNAASIWARHFGVYAGAGATSVRIQTGWSDQQYSNGAWRNPTTLPYMQAAVAHGLSLSIDLETIAAPPAWFIDANPDARLVDQNGLTTEYQTISYWYPGLTAMIHAKTDIMLSMLSDAGILASVSSLIVSLGPADEPIYPPQWTIGNGAKAPGFWCYDVHAQADFVVQMTAKYHTIAAANAAWGTSYASFDALSLPKPGTVPTAEWTDVIAWYRTTKRAFVAWQIADTAAELAKWAPTHTPTLIVPIPGEHVSGAELAAALAAESSSDPAIVQMNDTEFMLDTAARNHAAAHFTGMPDMPELEFIRGYIRGRGYDVKGMLLSAENVANVGVSTAAAEFTAEALALDLDGFDYLYGSALFASDNVTAGPTLQTATAMEAAITAGRDARGTLTLAPNFALVQNACVDVSPPGAAPATELCLSTAGRLSVTSGPTTLWQAAAASQACPASVAWNQGCFALLQSDGNFVLYDGQTGYWNSATSATGAAVATKLTLSVGKPYLTLTTAAGATVWDSSVGKH